MPPLREYFVTDNGRTSIGFILALAILLLAVVALFGGISPTPKFTLGLVAGLALARLL